MWSQMSGPKVIKWKGFHFIITAVTNCETEKCDKKNKTNDSIVTSNETTYYARMDFLLISINEFDRNLTKITKKYWGSVAERDYLVSLFPHQ
jgi:hypothetical protein